MLSWVGLSDLEKGINLKETKSEYNKSLYKKLRPVRIILIISTLALMFFTKPAWCVDKGDTISVAAS